MYKGTFIAQKRFFKIFFTDFPNFFRVVKYRRPWGEMTCIQINLKAVVINNGFMTALVEP